MRKKKLTPVQIKLFTELVQLISETHSEDFSVLRSKTNCKSFDLTFNAILFKGWLDRDNESETNNFFIAK